MMSGFDCFCAVLSETRVILGLTLTQVLEKRIPNWSNELTYRKEKSSLRFFTNQKNKNDDLPCQHCIKPHFREATSAENSLIPRFFSQKATVLCTENGGFISKKRRNEPQETAVLETDSYFCKHQNRLSC